MKFRTLKANEIDCRISTINDKGLALLLYKDARVDQNILDETVGEMNWQRKHTRDNANCIVSIWDSNKSQWIEKEDTGTESFSEAEKGLASDSFKRACFNWGIGRELYTAPFIWITKDNCKIDKKKDQNGKEKYTCNDKFKVQQIEYNENREITSLVIVNKTIGDVVFNYGSKIQVKQTESSKTEKPKTEPSPELKEKAKLYATIKDLMVNKNITGDMVLEQFKKKSVDMSIDELKELIKWLEGKEVQE